MSGLPCAHAMAAYLHMKIDPDLGVSEWYTQINGLRLTNIPLDMYLDLDIGSLLAFPNLYHQLREKCLVGQGKKGSGTQLRMIMEYQGEVELCIVISVGRLGTIRRLVLIQKDQNLLTFKGDLQTE